MKSIMVIEDEKDIREVTASMLAHCGYNASTAGSPETAMAEVERTAIDLIVTDVYLNAAMDGFTMAQLLRERGWSGKFIFTSGDPEAASYSRQLGSDAVFLSKPYGRRKLLEAIDSLS